MRWRKCGRSGRQGHTVMLASRDTWPASRLLVPTLACLTAIACMALSDRADALPLGSLTHVRPTYDSVACRPPPWFRGLQDVAPFVCGTWWGWPRFYSEE